jgi:hypothetical protein
MVGEANQHGRGACATGKSINQDGAKLELGEIMTDNIQWATPTIMHRLEDGAAGMRMVGTEARPEAG